MRRDEYIDQDGRIRRAKKDIYDSYSFPYCCICGKSTRDKRSVFNEGKGYICSNKCSNIYYRGLKK